MSASEAFENELEIFRTEAEAAAQFLYAYLSVHESAGRHPSVVRLLNTAPLFWSTNLGALQTAAFIALGRIFDQDSPHNIDRVLGIAQKHREIFSREALAVRKQGQCATRPDWLDGFLAESYVPLPSDFRRLRREVSNRRKIYDEKYRDIRHKVFAHKQVVGAADVGALFDKTNARELQLLVTFTWSLYDALWQLYFNGTRPLLRQRRYSVKAMRNRPTPKRQMQTVQERITDEAARFLRAAAK
jgi:AbiU2